MTRTYQGTRNPDPHVTVDGADLNPRTDIRNHGPGLNWGYGGSGPAQLAVAILADHLEHHPQDAALLLQAAAMPDKCDVCDGATVLRGVSDNPADETPCWNCQAREGERHPHRLVDRVHQDFKWRVVAKLPDKEWTLRSEDVRLKLGELAAIARAKRGDAAAAQPVRMIVSRARKPPVVETVKTDLKSLQALVGGPIEVFFPRFPGQDPVLESGLCFVMNEEGGPRFQNLPVNPCFGRLGLRGTILVTRIVDGVHVDLDADHAVGFLRGLLEEAARTAAAS